MKCPRCKKNELHSERVMNSLSRRVRVYICSDCGVEESLIDLGKTSATDNEKKFLAKIKSGEIKGV